MPAELQQLLAYLVLFAAIPAIAAIILLVFVKKPFERGVERLFGSRSSSAWTASRNMRLSADSSSNTLRWSAGPDAADVADSELMRSERAPMAAATLRQYRDAWQRIDAYFQEDPAEAVRAGHNFVLQLARERGQPAAITTEMKFSETSVTGAAASMRMVYQQMRDAREAAHISERALANENVSVEDLTKAMHHYRRIAEQLLD